MRFRVEQEGPSAPSSKRQSTVVAVAVAVVAGKMPRTEHAFERRAAGAAAAGRSARSSASAMSSDDSFPAALQRQQQQTTVSPLAVVSPLPQLFLRRHGSNFLPSRIHAVHVHMAFVFSHESWSCEVAGKEGVFRWNSIASSRTPPNLELSRLLGIEISLVSS